MYFHKTQNTPLEESDNQKNLNFDMNEYVSTNESSENGELVSKSTIQFGIGIEESEGRVPKIFEELISFLRRNALRTENIFKETGPKELIDDLSKKNYLDILENLKNDENNIEYHHAIASLLKIYLQSMSTPLLSPNVTTKFDLKDIQSMINALPEKNCKMLELSMSLMFQITQNSTFNKMTPSILSRCIAPSIFKSNSEILNKICEEIILNFPNLNWMPKKATIATPCKNSNKEIKFPITTEDKKSTSTDSNRI